MYGLGDTLARALERRETQIRAGEGISGTLSVTSSLNLGSYTGRLDNLNLAGMKNPSPNLTTMYLDTPLVVPTPEPLEYVPSRYSHVSVFSVFLFPDSTHLWILTV